MIQTGECLGLCIFTSPRGDSYVSSRMRTRLGDLWSILYHLSSTVTRAVYIVSLLWSFIFVVTSVRKHPYSSFINSFSLLKAYPPLQYPAWTNDEWFLYWFSNHMRPLVTPNHSTLLCCTNGTRHYAVVSTAHTLRKRSGSHTHSILISCTEFGTNCVTNINLTCLWRDSFMGILCFLQCKLWVLTLGVCVCVCSSLVPGVLAQCWSRPESILTLNQTNWWVTAFLPPGF